MTAAVLPPDHPALLSHARQIVNCDAKATYATLLKALVVADHWRHKAGRSLHPFRCRICGDWHLTSQRPARGRR